ALTAAMIVTGCLGYSAGKEVIKPRSALSGLDAIMKAPDDWGYEREAFIYRDLLFSRIGGTQGPATIFIGDSNMEQYLPRISHLITNDPHTYQRAIYTTSGSCPPIRNIRDPSDSSNRCHTRMDAAYRLAMETTDINKVVIAAMWFGYFIGTRDIFYDD